MDINTILTPILIALGTGLAALVTWGFTMLQAWLSKKIKDDKLRLISNTVLDLIRDSVLFVNQTIVEQLKKDGKFDAEAQHLALSKALERVKANLTKESLAILTELYGDVETWLQTQIEAFVNRSK